MASPNGNNKVIVWDDAMEQCGGDEEFLRELLDDLRGEVDVQATRIVELLQTRPVDWIKVKRAAHVIKGASANLMCTQMNLASSDLEMKAGRFADGLDHPTNDLGTEICTELQNSVNAFHRMLESIGV
uniref:HPt domain-containing protein n=1 Tax=Corethron hystrix TaxID=216773 RepID=A0A7S1BKY6_9STRA|mmetsp:Transcript_3032/g.5676  ORF Transcript_3032/g.5676 Transcript_3032/m.5676 type:complete len:128 (+) Transcript_3032:135-518(+)|eukprot:CAMPEP_0113298964 /NCGR_PEP_ID=MMETSP0010_2-20120614/1186_1 /TAXON_ID=216773 ORGANISM="Corethron hystrix, Strain 308" /NCGR_SAMPLE_ID=MMETSP0010_2 /ASSEMBLY_ACC=CAM_ASM_000155 /LENGTH=127 /DNA_ID=CAMNT_0000152099 /DNA_START=114 /DNA_END=497 /DNA_ORIENTATION=- /assembly_acc=CAM_ASM_000155